MIRICPFRAFRFSVHYNTQNDPDGDVINGGELMTLHLKEVSMEEVTPEDGQ